MVRDKHWEGKVSTTRQDRIRFLRSKINELAETIESNNLEKNFLTYLERIAKDPNSAAPVSEEEWELFLPAEKDSWLFDFYQSMRTELVGLVRERDAVKDRSRLQSFLESKWTRTVTTGVALAKLAELIIELAQSSGLFLRAPEDERDRH